MKKKFSLLFLVLIIIMITILGGCQNNKVKFGKWRLFLLKEEDKVVGSYIKMPKEYQLKKITDSAEEKVKKVNLNTIIEEDRVISAKNENIDYLINIAGYDFRGKGMYINSQGLFLKKISLKLHNSFWDDIGQDNLKEKIVFNDVKISSKTNQVIGDYLVELNENINYNYWGVKLTDIKLGEKQLFIGGYLNDKEILSNHNIRLKMLINSDISLGSMILSDSSIIEFENGAFINIKKGNLNSENIIIKEATFSLPQDNNSLDISLGNFMISKYGRYSLKEDFFSEKFTFDYKGIEYNIPSNALDFIGGNIIVKKGEASFRDSREKLSINNLYLLNQKDSLKLQGNYFNLIEREVKGIPIQAKAGYQQGSKIIFTEGRIYLPIIDGHGEKVSLGLRNLNYGADGFDLSNLQIYTPYFNYNRLGVIRVTQIKKEKEGLVLEGEITLGSIMPEGLRHRDLKLKPFSVNAQEGINENLVAKIPSDKPLTMENFLEFSANKLYFRDDKYTKSFYLKDGTMKFIGEIKNKFNLPEININAVEIDHYGDIRQFDTEMGQYKFDLRGLETEVFSLESSSYEVSFLGSSKIPQLSNDFVLPIYSLKVNPDNGKITDFILSANGTKKVNFAGWDFKIHNIIVKEDSYNIASEIKFPKKLYELMNYYREVYFEVDEFILGQNGQVKEMKFLLPHRLDYELGDDYMLIAKDPKVVIEDEKVESFDVKFDISALFLPKEYSENKHFRKQVLLDDNIHFDNEGNFYYKDQPLEKWVEEKKDFYDNKNSK